MTFRRSLNEYKREQDTSVPFPGERRTQSGLFSGSESRLVHVNRTGELRDYSYPLSGLHGIVFSRFGIRTPEETYWFANYPTQSQVSHPNSALVETIHDVEGFEVVQRDGTVDQSHLTTFELGDGDLDFIEITGFVEFAPDGQEGRSGQLVHDDTIVEVYHNQEHDYLGSATEFSTVNPETPERFNETLSEEAQSDLSTPATDDSEGNRLTNGVYFRAPLKNDWTTVVSVLSDAEEQPRSDGLAGVDERRQQLQTPADLLALARCSYPFSGISDELVTTDLRTLYLLSAPTGARIAGPEFDPYYQYSGGYGYTWFRDDAEIAMFLLQADRVFGLGLEDLHQKTARFYLQTQLDDGRWPHRVWPMNGHIAPGWANGHIEGTEQDYQADQTASALVFLSEYLTAYEESIDDGLVHELGYALDTGVNGLNSSMEEDGLPTVCENAWENMNGRFTHTAAVFLRAYSSIAAGSCAPALEERALERARAIYENLDTLWDPGEEFYAVRLDGNERDTRADSTTLSLVDAHLAYARVSEIDDRRLGRLDTHIGTTFDRLWRETEAIRGLKRFEGDSWRRGDQESAKIWTVSTGWGAYAAERSRRLFSTYEHETDFEGWAARLFAEIAPTGSLCLSSGYLPEQFFDSGDPDSATPLGWSHALRLATHAARTIRDT